MFNIKAYSFHWLEGIDARYDLCLHGHAVAEIGEERLEYENAAVSATALYLLKSLTEDHTAGKSDVQMMPCCGHFMVADKALSEVIIVGCSNGIDWSVFHDGDLVRIVTESGNEVCIHIDDYRKNVFEFVDTVEAFYEASEKKAFADAYDKNAYTAFCNEWKRRRYSQ